MILPDSCIEECKLTADNPFYVAALNILLKYKKIFMSNIKSHIVYNEEVHTIAVLSALLVDSLQFSNKPVLAVNTNNFLKDFYKEYLNYDDNSYYIEELLYFYQDLGYSWWEEDFGSIRFVWADYLKDNPRKIRISENMEAVGFWRIFSVYCDILPNPELAKMEHVSYCYHEGQLTRHDPYLAHCYTQKTVIPLMQCATDFNKEIKELLQSI